MKRLRGIQVPHRKHTAASQAAMLPCPKAVAIPLSMHIGAPAIATVKPGDQVFVGTMIGQADGMVSSPVHASVSGKVKKLETRMLAGGRMAQVVLVEADGLQQVDPNLGPVSVETYEEFLGAVRDSGVVGLGGAGFPTAAKLAVKDPALVETVLINGAECEPYITSDTRTMLDDTESLVEGARLLRRFLGVKSIIFAVEANKPECIKALEKAVTGEAGMEVRKLPAMYPQGGEKVLIYHVLGRMVPEGKLPLDVGAIVLNCTTLAAIARYVKTGMPLVEKCITVDGSAVAKPQNVRVPIGTSMEDVLAFCGGFRTEPAKVLYGGPMMGIAVPDLTAPILKNTNAVLAFGQKEAHMPQAGPCIGCGRCSRACPLRLMPAEFDIAYQLDRVQTLDALKVNLCMECGCCSYVCPAGRHLVQTNKLAKAKLAAWKAEKKEAKTQ